MHPPSQDGCKGMELSLTPGCRGKACDSGPPQSWQGISSAYSPLSTPPANPWGLPSLLFPKPTPDPEYALGRKEGPVYRKDVMVTDRHLPVPEMPRSEQIQIK